VIRQLLARRADVAWLAFWSLVQALPSVASGWSLAEATSRFLAGQAAAGMPWLGLLAVAYAAGALGTRNAYLRAGAIVEPLRDELVTSIVGGSLARSTSGTAVPADTRSVARLTHQAEVVRDSLAGLLVVTSSFVFTIGSALVGLVTLVPASLPWIAPPLVVACLLLRLLFRPARARQRAVVLAGEETAENVARVVSGLRDVTACGAEGRVLGELSGQIDQQADAARSAAVISAARIACLAVGGWLPLLLVLAAAPSMLGHGVSAGALVGVITYITGSMRSALYTGANGIGTGLIQLRVTLDRIRQTSSPAAETDPVPGAVAGIPAPRRPPVTETPRTTAREIELRDVRFAYGPHAAPVLDGLSLSIPPGDHLAIAGPSGIGKSSLAALIAGTLRPTAGQVLYGVPVSAQGKRWRTLLPQEAYVFAGTITENLTYYSEARVCSSDLDLATGQVGLAPLLSRLGGYDAEISPAALSAGERQLIALTRAYLSAAPVIILDEATCHLDPAAEEQAEEAFARRGGTLIVIAHRITSARRAKRILVLDGVRAQVGDHASLLAGSPMYRDLVGYWDAQDTDARRGRRAERAS
jgi:ATP-binding cassette subfamily C protein